MADGALQGVIVLDLTWVLSRPYAPLALTDPGPEGRGRAPGRPGAP
jgi:hypothetical protein